MTLSKSESGKLGAIKSKETSARLLEERVNTYDLDKSKCKNCNTDLEYKNRNNKYCSRSCSVTVANKNKVKREVLNCLKCNKSLLGKAIEMQYCSAHCHQSAIKEEQWQELNKNDSYVVSHRTLRAILIFKFGSKCMECGWDKINPATNKCPIELEHIDGDHTNNKISNVKLLCPNCHSLTVTYKALNKGNGREKRRKSNKPL